MLILIGDQGTGDLDIRYMGQHVGIAQLPGEEHNVAGILALFVNILDLLQAVIHIFMEETAEILHCNGTVDEIQGFCGLTMLMVIMETLLSEAQKVF